MLHQRPLRTAEFVREYKIVLIQFQSLKKRIFFLPPECGVRPHHKSGRIVGGKASSFGEFPWQVLVRESTWLGLFTKNKCGGVLISNSYVVTAGRVVVISP